MKYILIIIFSCWLFAANAQQKNKTENIILITLDGFRWEEVFNGADSALMKQQKHLKDAQLKEKFWRDNLAERKKALLPFFWNTIGTQGQLYGNRMLGCPRWIAPSFVHLAI